MIIKHKCPTCQKPASLRGEAKVGSMYFRTYVCGHTEMVQGLKPLEYSTYSEIISLDNKRLFKYQVEDCEWLDTNNGRALVAHEMGVGKTPISLAWLKAHEEARPFVAVVKSGLRLQWLKEAVRWCDFTCQIIDSARAFFLPGVDGYIVSLDSLRLFYDKKDKDKEESRLKKFMNKIGIKTVILDECQLIKNNASQRTNEVRKLVENVEHVIALSGTPIKNNASEYFPVLNILRPDKFPPIRTSFMVGANLTTTDIKPKQEGLRT